jgi:integrase
MRLTEATIRAVEPPAHGYRLVADAEITGLGLRVLASKTKTFTYTYVVEGRQRRLTIGPWPEWSATAARERAKELRQQVDRGEDPLAEKQLRREAITVEELAHAYLDRHAKKKKSGADLRRYLERDVLPAWGKWKAADVRKRDVIALVERKAESTPVAANMLLAVVRGLFNWAIKNDCGVELNPAYRVARPAKVNPRDRWLNEQEIRQVWERLDTAAMGAASKAALRLILTTAQRPGEVVGAAWSEIETATAWWTIPAERAKNNIQHGVPLSGLALEQLEKLAGRGPWVMASKGGRHLTTKTVSNAVARNQAHFGIPRWTPHDLRRTAATHMAKAGVARFVVHRILNHADKDITSTYDRHSYDAEKKAALEKWARELGRILGTPTKAKVVQMGR